MRLLGYASVLLALVLLQACSPDFSSPLGEPGKIAYDERLIGVWLKTDGVVATYLHITPSEKEEQMLAINVLYIPIMSLEKIWSDLARNAGDEIPGSWFRANAYPSEVGGRIYYKKPLINSLVGVPLI